MAGTDENNTLLDIVSREVPDSAVGPELTDEQKVEQAVNLVQRAITALQGIDEKLNLIDRALGSSLVDALKGISLGKAVDMVSELKLVMDRLGGDGGSVALVAKRLRYVREVTMPELLDAADVKTFNTDRFRVTKTIALRASINPEGGYHTEGEFAGQPMAYDWLRANDYESLIKPTVNASSLSAAAKELIEQGKELPENLFKVHSQPSISITKKAQKG